MKCSIVREQVWKKEQRSENEHLFNKNEINMDAYFNIDLFLVTQDRFENVNKHHSLTQYGRKPVFGPILESTRRLGTDLGALGKMLITPEQYKQRMMALRRSNENDFVYRMVIYGSKIEPEIWLEYRLQTFS